MKAQRSKGHSTNNGASFSNGGMGTDEDQWSGNPIRPVHWWHWA